MARARNSRLRTLLVVLLALFLCGCASDGSSIDFDPEHSDFTPSTVAKFPAFPLYWLGTSFEGLELASIDGPSRSDGTISFVYGTCSTERGTDGGCAPPIEIQATPLCRHVRAVARNPIWRHRRVRGAPVGQIDAAVLFSRKAQVKLYARDQKVALRALKALRSANKVKPVIDASDPIPPAPRAVLAGRRPCSR